MIGPDGETLSPADVLRIIAARARRLGDTEVIVSRDDAGEPCSARRVVHRGGVNKKSWVPLPSNEQAVAAEAFERHAAWLLRALWFVAGFASQPLTLVVEVGEHRGAWIPDYAVVLLNGQVVLLEVKTIRNFPPDKRERLRSFFEHARLHGFLPALWTDKWLKKDALVSNLSFLYRYREHQVDSATLEAVQRLLIMEPKVRLADIAPHTDLLHCVYALIAQGRLHADLRSPLGLSTVICDASQNKDQAHGQAELFAGRELSP